MQYEYLSRKRWDTKRIMLLLLLLLGNRFNQVGYGMMTVTFFSSSWTLILTSTQFHRSSISRRDCYSSTYIAFSSGLQQWLETIVYIKQRLLRVCNDCLLTASNKTAIKYLKGIIVEIMLREKEASCMTLPKVLMKQIGLWNAQGRKQWEGDDMLPWSASGTSGKQRKGTTKIKEMKEDIQPTYTMSVERNELRRWRARV